MMEFGRPIKVTYFLDSPWPSDARNPEAFEALTWKRTGELPFMPQLGLLMECGDGELRKVHEIYWYVDRPHEIELYFEDEEYKHDTAYYLTGGWTTEDLPSPPPTAPGRKKRERAHG